MPTKILDIRVSAVGWIDLFLKSLLPQSLLTYSSHQDILFETETFILKITFITTFWDIKCRENLHKYGDDLNNQ